MEAHDSGAHILNSLCWSVESDVAEVFAFIDNKGCAVDINSAINIRFKNGVMASIAIGGNCPANGADLHYMFDDGRINIDGWSASWIEVYKPKGEKVENPPITDNMFAGSPAQNFVDAILGRAEARTTPDNGIVQCELMDAIYKSASTGKVAVPS